MHDPYDQCFVVDVACTFIGASGSQSGLMSSTQGLSGLRMSASMFS